MFGAIVIPIWPEMVIICLQCGSHLHAQPDDMVVNYPTLQEMGEMLRYILGPQAVPAKQFAPQKSQFVQLMLLRQFMPGIIEFDRPCNLFFI